MFRSTSARFAALYTAWFALTVVVFGAITLLSMHGALTHQFDRRVRAESQALVQEFRTDGLARIVQTMAERERTRGPDYGLDTAQGRPLAGRLAGLHAPLGWSIVQMHEADGELERVRALTAGLPGGYRLIVGDAVKRTAAIERPVLEGFCCAFAGVIALGIFGGYRFSRDVQRRLADMTAAADAIILGDLNRRIPVGGTQDDLDRLAGIFNRTLDRISGLMDSLRHVSNDIAHDLRTPLTRLRQRLEAIRGLRSPAERDAAVEGALHDVDTLLATFSALLRIAQVEGGTRRAAFRSADLAIISRTVVDAFAPSAEDIGQVLSFEGETPTPIIGDVELLTQMLANLVENALRHAGGRAHVIVRTWRSADECGVCVSDDGPGVPEAEFKRIFDRFYRLERSRSTPGDGLGLALVAAIARLHGASIKLASAGPGLRLSVVFAAEAARLGFPNLEDISPPHRVG